MKLCAFGAGAIGGHLAAKLAAAGHEVSVVARGAQLQAMRAGGVTLQHGEQLIAGRVRASDDPAQLGPQDLIFVTLKATALGAFVAGAAPLLGPDTAAVFVQNGIPWWYAQGLSPARPRPPDLSRLDPHAALARAIAPQRVIGAVAYSSNDVLEPGVIRNHTPGRNMLVVGEPDDRESGRISALRTLLERADMASPPCADLRAVVWNKLLQNFGAMLALLIEGPASAVFGDPLLRALRERLAQEGTAIAAAHGVRTDLVPARPGGGGHGAGATAHKPSILQDYERGRPMEIEAQLMAPVAFARSAGVRCPTLDAIAALAAHKAAAKGLYAA